jgi:hypothetical protein
MTFEAFIVEMIFFIEMAGSRVARPRRLRLSLTKPLRRRGRLRIDRESKSSDLSSGPSPFFPILFLFLLLSPKLRLAYYSRHLKRGNPIKATEYDEQLEQALEEGMEFSGSLQHRLVPTVSTLRIAA